MMKRVIHIIVLLVCICQTIHAQDQLRMYLDRYDYGKAVEAIDSLMACENADSVGLAVQKAKWILPSYTTFTEAWLWPDIVPKNIRMP